MQLMDEFLYLDVFFVAPHCALCDFFVFLLKDFDELDHERMCMNLEYLVSLSIS